jgi:multimeric flavodoxin WrbA
MNHNPLIFATPVYWYSMSGRMKTFWDRVTDLFYHHKELSQGLRGKTAMVIASSSGGKPDGFEMPLEKTFAYLKMDYMGCWDYIFPLDAHTEHNQKQKALAGAQWEILVKKLQSKA